VVECARKEAKVSKLTKASCAACHGSSLEGLTGPSLAGPEFTARWSREDRSLESFYYILRMIMPRDAGNSLSEKRMAGSSKVQQMVT
jgi:mono/diheme cytochrome c family protein